MPFVRMITGTARSGRAGHIDALLRDRLDESLLVVPTSAYARRRAGVLLERTGRRAVLNPPVITFGELAKRILQGSEFEATPIGPLEQRSVLHRAIARSRAKGSLDLLGDASESEGFLDHLLTIIGQLKQAAIEPRQFRQQVRARRHAMDQIVAEVYSAYQDELKHSGSVDLQGMYWLARIVCEGMARPPQLGHLRRLLVDDFDDFTPSEFRVIRALSVHVEELVFGLNLSEDPERKNLYALPLATRDALRRSFPDSEAFDCDEPGETKQSEFIASSLLVRKEIPAPPALNHDVRFVECHTLSHEIETTARSIKQLVRSEGATLSNIAVVWRNTANVAAPMREIFAEFGVPLAGLEIRTLAESSVAGFVFRFFNAAQTWAPHAVLDVLTAPWFFGPSTAHADIFPILVRAARVRPGHHGWRSSLERLARYLDDPMQIELQRLVRHVPQAHQVCATLLETLARFSAQCETVVRPKPIAAHVEAILGLLDQWPLAGAMVALPSDDERLLEENALAELRRALGVLGKLHTADTAPTDIGRFVQMLRRALAVSTFSTPPREGAVACLGMESARYLHFEHVFLAGVTDAHVPANRKLSALYTEDERAELGAAGIVLERGDIHNQRELLLFQRMFMTASRCLTVSWHRQAPGGATVQRSLYLNEVADRIGGLQEHKPVSPGEVIVPSPNLAGCTRDLQNLAVPGGIRSLFAEAAAAAKTEQQRYGFRSFDEHDGVLIDKNNAAWLQEHYGAAHVYSASQLEAYAECPFRFFQERILDLLNIEPPDQAFDHLARGAVLHDALEGFHRRYLGKTVAHIPCDDANATMAECANAAFNAMAIRFRNLTPGMLAAERARMLATLQRYLRLQREPKKNAPEAWPTLDTEVAFGRAGEHSTLPPFVLELDSGEVRLAGRIDRIDRCGDKFRVIDYKSSPIKPKKLKEGKIFQLALYALAAEKLLYPGEHCEDAYYLAVGHDKNPVIALGRSDKKASYEERIGIARTAVAAAVAGIRAGKFHPVQADAPCSGCLDQKVCRFERSRLRRKQAP